MNIRVEEEETIELPIVPMIDCAFLLLVFFLIATTMKKPESQEKQVNVYKISVPKAEAPQTISTEDARRILVTAEGDVALPGGKKADDKYLTLVALVDDLKVYRIECEQKQKEPVIVIVGDKDAKYQRIIQVWNAIKNAGIRQVSFSVEPGKPNDG
ncbi:MAG: biopolymer transporter ExbD [Planctomycetes bacterium]|nr:biopolymer transporter ExbD [Planctomycetota bacterium]